jgi:hypothetical protein
MKIRTLLLISLVCMGLASCDSCSSDELCDDTCTKWANCGHWNYDTCYDQCKDDGNWSSAYRDCILSAACSESALDYCDYIYGGRPNRGTTRRQGSPGASAAPSSGR